MTKNPEHRLTQEMLLTVLNAQEDMCKFLSSLAIKMEAGHAALEAQALQRLLGDARKCYRVKVRGK